MTANRSLDDFAAGSDDPSNAVGDTPDADAEAPVDAGPVAPSTEADERTDADTTEAVASTYRWTPDGAPCAACGELANERWRGDDGLVCLGCKEW